MNPQDGGKRPARPPSWRAVTSEADAARRQLAQAQRSLERASDELRGLRAWGDRTARLDLARRLTGGDDGGVLNLLLAGAGGAPGEAQRACRAGVDRLTAALGLEPVGERGEHLRLELDQMGEFEVRGGAATRTAVYRVVRPGWTLAEAIVCRPVLEAMQDGPDA